MRVQGDLLAAHALGIRNVFVVMGDPTSIGDYPEAADNYDIVPSGLIKLIKQGFNTGVDHSGDQHRSADQFFRRGSAEPETGRTGPGDTQHPPQGSGWRGLLPDPAHL